MSTFRIACDSSLSCIGNAFHRATDLADMVVSTNIVRSACGNVVGDYIHVVVTCSIVMWRVKARKVCNRFKAYHHGLSIVFIAPQMSDSEGYFDDDPINFDAEALGQLDAIEAAALAVDNVPQSDYDDSFGDLSLALDPAEAARLDAYIAEVIDVDAQPSASSSTLSRSTSRATLQTTLFGDVLQPQASSSRPKPTNSIQRTKSNPKTPFGRPAPKTKKWDHTAFAKTGLRKPLPKSKNKDGQDAHDSDEEGEDFEQFPAPFIPGEATDNLSLDVSEVIAVIILFSWVSRYLMTQLLLKVPIIFLIIAQYVLRYRSG